MNTKIGKLITSPFKAIGNFLKKSQTMAAIAIRFRGAVGVFGNPLNGTMSFAEAVQNGYKGLVWVYRCINAYGDAVGSVSWVAYRKKPDGTEELLPDHALEKLINRPNKHHSRQEFFSTWAIYLMLAGEAYWEVGYDNSKKKLPVALYNLRPDWMTPVPDPKLYIGSFKFDVKDGTKPLTLDPQTVVFFKLLNPEDPYRGMSPLSAAARSIETENRAINWNNSLLENNAIPGGVLSVPASNLDENERADIQKSLDEEFSGLNAHRPMVLWGGMTWQQMALSTKDMDFPTLRNMSKQEICAVLGVPAEMVGANPDAKFANYGTARQSFWEDRVIPFLEWLQSMINDRLAPAWGDGVKIRYDISNHPAMMEAFVKKVSAAKILIVDCGWTLNQVNRRLGMGFANVPWGDVAWMTSSKVPVSSDQPIMDPNGLQQLGEEDLALEDGEDPKKKPEEDDDEEDDAETVVEDEPKPKKKPKVLGGDPWREKTIERWRKDAEQSLDN